MVKILSKEDIKLIAWHERQDELVRWIEAIESIVKDSKDLMYMTPMSALSILKTKMQAAACDYQHQSDMLKLKIVKRNNK